MIFIISIALLKLTLASSTFLNAESNYYKPRLERNNVVNKGVWVKDKFLEDTKPHISDFIFKSSSMDVDDLLDNGFYTFGSSFVENTPFVSNYIERAKRSPDVKEKQRFRKSMKKCATNQECFLNNLIEDKILVASKLMTKLKPASVFNDYPHEVAVLLRNAYSNDDPNNVKNVENLDQTMPLNEYNKSHVDIQILVDDAIMNNRSNELQNISLPKRSMNDQNSNFPKQSEMVGYYFGSESKKNERKSLTNDRILQEDAPLTKSDAYRVVPAIERHKFKYINEGGLMKIITVLSKAFKKIMRQHAEIKKIHNKLYTIKQDVDSSVNVLFAKFEEFDRQYTYIANISEKNQYVEKRLEAQSQYISNKENELSKNLIEFESKQKKFLTQQREFYNVQKLMLAQNEKINTKQNIIAKTQSEISHRQYNFARILKKAKEIYIDSKPSQFTDNVDKPQKATHTTTTVPLTTDSIKIDLFSIPPSTRPVNQDNLIMKEIDQQSVDELIYKYYFNNTFIDTVMKNKILAGYSNENNQIMRNVNKRNENTETVKSTILLPVNNTNNNVGENKVRQRRWIRHSRRFRRKHRGKIETSTNIIDDEKKRNQKTSAPIVIDGVSAKDTTKSTTDSKRDQNKNKPFMTMASKFCNQIGHNGNTQVLNWCIEKALRRLQNIDIKIPVMASSSLLRAAEHTMSSKAGEMTWALESTTTDTKSKPVKVSLISTSNLPIDSSATLQTTPATHPDMATTSGFFPDNEELESNLKQYEIVTDKEGVFYYDSAPVSDGHESSDGGISDMMLGLESNSRIDVDPLTFDLHARRRASVKRINENIRRKFHG